MKAENLTVTMMGVVKWAGQISTALILIVFAATENDKISKLAFGWQLEI